MNRQPFCRPPRWWSPKLSPGWVRFWRRRRKRMQREQQRLLEVEVRGLEHVRRSVDQGRGVLITPNHASHADCYSIYESADQLGSPIYVMIAWQNFAREGRFKALVLRQHGGFSVDREGTDMRAFRQAADVLMAGRYPLVIFPEGEVYHVNDRITPFREGPAAIAITAARKKKRPVVCVPCGIRYRYVEDPMPELLRLMDDLERAILWRPRPDLPLAERIYRFAEGALALKELEFLGNTRSGSVPERIAGLVDAILSGIGDRYGVATSEATVPERVKALRRQAIERMGELPEADPGRRQLENDLDDLFMVVQAFSYPGDYVAQRPTVERMAETLDKFEEDVLGVRTATIRASRRAVVTFGEPIPIDPTRGKRGATGELTRLLETRVQALLDATAEDGRSNSGDPPTG